MQEQHFINSFQQPRDRREKTFVDYWNTVVKRWKIVVLVFAITVLGSALYFKKFLSQVYFPFITIIEVGGTDGQLLESLSAIEAKIKEAYIPLAITEHARKNNYAGERYLVDVEAPKESNIVRLRARGREEDSENILDIERSVVSRFIADHEQRIAAFKEGLQRDKFRFELELDELKYQERLFPAQQQRLNDSARILERQIVETKNLIAQSEQNRLIILSSEAKREAASASLATTLLLIDNELQRNRDRIMKLEQQSNVDLKQQKEDLQKSVADNKRLQALKKQSIEEMQFKIDHLRKTAVIFPPERLLSVPSRSMKQFLQFMGLLGLFFGVVGALFVEFAVQARRDEMDRVR